MKKASSQFFVLVLSMLFVSLQSYGQVPVDFQYSDSYPAPSEQETDFEYSDLPSDHYDPYPSYPDSPSVPSQDQIHRVVHLSLLPYDSVRVAEALSLSPYEMQNLEVISLSVNAQSLQRPGTLLVRSHGRQLQSLQLGPQLRQVDAYLSGIIALDSLELSASDNVYVQSISLQVRRRGHSPYPSPYPGPSPLPYERQVSPYSTLNLQVNRSIYGMGEIPLKKLIKDQLGLSIAGAQILRVTVEGSATGYSQASLQVEINNRPVGRPKFLRGGQSRAMLQVDSVEQINTLGLNVSGNAVIHSIIISVGDVRPQGPHGHPTRISINQEVSSYRPLLLSQLLPYESRLVRSVGIQATTRYGQADLTLASVYGSVLGSVRVSQIPLRPVIRLIYPVSVRELRLESYSTVLVETLELEF